MNAAGLQTNRDLFRGVLWILFLSLFPVRQECPWDKFQYTHRVQLQINSRFYPKARAKRRYEMRSAGWYLDFRILFPPLFRRCQNRINLEVNAMSMFKFIPRTLQVSEKKKEISSFKMKNASRTNTAYNVAQRNFFFKKSSQRQTYGAKRN